MSTVENLPFKALIFDSLYDPYKGVVVFFRVVQGALKAGDKVRFLNSRSEVRACQDKQQCV